MGLSCVCAIAKSLDKAPSAQEPSFPVTITCRFGKRDNTYTYYQKCSKVPGCTDIILLFVTFFQPVVILVLSCL